MKNLGRAVAALLLSAFPAYAGEVPPSSLTAEASLLDVEEYSTTPTDASAQPLDVPGLDPTDVAAELNQPTNLEPVPGRPTRSEDEAAELEPRGDDAEEEAEEEEVEGLETLLGEQWHQLGPISAEAFYTSEVFNNTRGGISTKGATRYRGNLDISLRLDTAAANWWDGGELYVYMQQSQGTTLTPQFVGDGQFYSNIDTSPKHQWLTQLGEYWYVRFGGDAQNLLRGLQST